MYPPRFKAGISFLAVYDGSCFDPVQAVINNSLPNYNEEVLHLTTGCSVVVTGKVVESLVKARASSCRRLR
jgi:asparaginyl-tRNA synthetase